MKQDFIDYVNALIAAAPEIEMNDNAKAYWTGLQTASSAAKPEITDNGKLILKYLQSAPAGAYKSKDIAEELFVSSRTVSGSIRKLVTDKFVEKIGSDPVVYSITEKGKNYIIND
jgi:DNA-binding MarR family transcriptional regulator